ncbi:MAG: ATP-binding protein [Hyphomicrobiales bacterium]|nr:ATP-binding protein [Hyphomicrobiales bacterium]
MSIGQPSNLNNLIDIESNLYKLTIPAWVWDADRNRIISANGHAVKFWNELSVLDLIDTVFGMSHPVSFQFSNAINYLKAAPHCISVAVDFSAINVPGGVPGHVNGPTDCQFSRLPAADGRNIILMKIADEADIAPQATTEPEILSATLEADDMVAKMLDNSPVALALFDSQGRFNYANKQCQQIFANSADQFVEPNSLADWFVDDENKLDSPGSTAQNLIEKCIKYNIANISVKIDTAFGARMHSIIAKSFAIKPFDDGSQYILVYMRDVADERHYEQILIDRISKLEQLTQLGSDFFFILDKNLNFVQVSGNFEQLTGYATADLLGRTWQDVATSFNLDPRGVASAHFADQTSFDYLNVEWPLKNSSGKLSLSWRGRSIFEQQQDEKLFVGSFVAAFERKADTAQPLPADGAAELDAAIDDKFATTHQTSKPYELEALVGALSAVGAASGGGAITHVNEQTISHKTAAPENVAKTAEPVVKPVETIVEPPKNIVEPPKTIVKTIVPSYQPEPEIITPTPPKVEVVKPAPTPPQPDLVEKVERVILPPIKTLVEPTAEPEKRAAKPLAVTEQVMVEKIAVEEVVVEEFVAEKPVVEQPIVEATIVEDEIIKAVMAELPTTTTLVVEQVAEPTPAEPTEAKTEITTHDVEQKTDDIAFAAQQTNLSDNEAVNFANLAEALADSEQAEPVTTKNIVIDDMVAEDDVVPEDGVVPEDDIVVEDDDAVTLADNIVPAFGATKENIAKFGRSEIDIFRMVLDQTPIMAAITSLPTQDIIYTLFANKQFLLYLGIIDHKHQDISALEYTNLLSVESMELLHGLKDEFGDTPVDREISFLVDGNKTYYNAKINKIKWQDDWALQFILSPVVELKLPKLAENDATINDIVNDNIKTDAEPVAAPNRMQTADILQFSLDGQAFIDENQVILSCNQKLAELVDVDTISHIIGKPIDAIIAPEQVSAFNDYLFSVLQDEAKNLTLDGLEVELLNKNSGSRAAYLHIQRLKSEDAKYLPSRILVSLRDVSEFKNKEAKLRDAKEQAELENQQKSGFLARISHELRTPLNAIIGFSDVMSNEKFGPLENNRYKGYAHDINESGAHLLSLINDLLDLSKVEAGKVELNFKALDLEPLIIQAVALMQPMADKKRIIIRTSISSTLPQIVADTRSIRQILLNLLSNSIKYSNSGSQVILSALLNEDGEVIIRVRDTGIGMNENQLKTAMEPFKTLDMANMAENQSTGLGLPLAKALAEANRAEFTIESAVSAGTLVQISFPTTRVLDT